MNRFPAWFVAFGQWCFRYRNAAFPISFLAVMLTVRPHAIAGHPALTQAVLAAGVVVAVSGQLTRLLTIGYDYIDRGGKDGKVWASRLAQGGIYAHTRNPMYLGNLLIAIGICLATGAPAAYLIVAPAFFVVYLAIIAAEEHYLAGRFGDDYRAYVAHVPRFFPSLRGLWQTVTSQPYHWRRALRKDLSTLAGLTLGLSCLPVWRTFFLDGPDAARAALPAALVRVGIVLACFALLAALKQRRLFFYLPSELSS